MALAVRAREYEERQQREEEEELHRRVDAQYTRPPVRVYGRERRKHGISVSYRRFPALAQLNDEELAAVTLVPESSMAATASTMQSEGSGDSEARQTQADAEPLDALSSFRASVIKKGSDHLYGTMRSQSDQWRKPRVLSTAPPIPFRQPTVSSARETITDMRNGYITMHTPYDAAGQAERRERLAAIAAHRHGPFRPSSSAQAKAAIRVHYFLNSPDTETFAAERQFIKDRAQANMEAYKREQRSKLLLLREREKKQDAELQLAQEAGEFNDS